jgi:hypothetical protein
LLAVAPKTGRQLLGRMEGSRRLYAARVTWKRRRLMEALRHFLSSLEPGLVPLSLGFWPWLRRLRRYWILNS